MSDPWSERLSEYLDDELEAAARAELEKHLARCADCRAELAGLRRAIDRLDTAPDHEPRHDLWPAIHQRLEAPGKPSRWKTGWQLVAAAALVALAVGLLLLRREAGVPSLPRVAAPDGAVAAHLEAVAEWRQTLDAARWSPQVEAGIRAEMGIFERSVAEALAAVGENPADAELRAYLVRTLQAQERFLARVGSVAEVTS